MLYKSEFVSPIYGIKRIGVDKVVAQRVNPNVLNSKSFYALQMSIFNSGFTSCPTGCLNENFEKSMEDSIPYLEKLKRHIEGTDEDMRSGGQNINFATEISDDNFRKCFQYELIDGAQRTGIIRLGTYYFFTNENHEEISKKWYNGENIPQEPGKYMMMYIAWRENFTIPLSINQNKNDMQKMSITVLSNVAKGSHDFKAAQDIICKLLNMGVNKEWISKNLFIDVDSINKIMQINGISSMFENFNEEDSWIPEEDPDYLEKQDCYLDRQALHYLIDYVNQNINNIKNNNIDDIRKWAEFVQNERK